MLGKEFIYTTHWPFSVKGQTVNILGSEGLIFVVTINSDTVAV